jgi:acetoin utilization deacetylase AcuC-like enzyme
MTGFAYTDTYLKHQTGAGHPERPERLTAVLDRLKQNKLLPELVPLPPQPAALEWITAVHTPAYAERVRKLCLDGAEYVDAVDTPVVPASYEAALLSAGGVLVAADAVMAGKVSNAFCLIRPPGHHALPQKAMGFCLFNNVAIAARYLQKHHHLARVLIVDWDVHHGNGTQDIFYEDPTVFYFSVHQSPLYPGTGSAAECGQGKGLGTKPNVPLPAGSGDEQYKKVYEEKLKPAADAFKPDFVLISAGFDAAQGDLLGRMKVTPEGYAALTRLVKAIARQHCQGRLVSLLEGGYNLQSLAASVEAHLRALQEP